MTVATTAETASPETASSQSAAPDTAAPETAAPAAPASNTHTGSNQTGTTHTGKDGRGILITEPAMRQLAALIGQQGAGKVLRVGVRSGGCSGMSYTMDFVEASSIREDDERYEYEPDGAPAFSVVCDPKSLLYIYGMQLDFSSALIGGGFNFTNPNATQTCGCGSSFAV